MEAVLPIFHDSGAAWTLLAPFTIGSGSTLEAIPGSALGVHGLAAGLKHGRLSCRPLDFLGMLYIIS